MTSPGAAAGGVPDDDPDSPLARRIRQAALRDHEKLLTAIEDGNADRAHRLAGAPLAATRQSAFASGAHERINANLVGGVALGTHPNMI